MGRKESELLGVELHEQEIRVVELKCRSGQTSVQKVGKVPMPLDCMMGGRVQQSELISQALRRLLDQMGIASAPAVVGLSSECTILRTMAVPAAPNEDLNTIVAGEICHHNILRSEKGAHAFTRLAAPCPPETGEEGGLESWALDSDFWAESRDSKINPDLVTVFGAEQESISCLRTVIEGAGLSVESVEPTQYGLFRSIIRSAGSSPTLLAIMIGSGRTDVAFVHKGGLVAYRRIDIGSRLLIGSWPNQVYPTVYGEQNGSSREGSEATAVVTELNRVALDDFATEIRRTLYYYEREYPSLSSDERIIVGLDDLRLGSIATELSSRLGTNVEYVRPVPNSHDSADAAIILSNPAGMVYAAAAGLAQQGNVLAKTPRMDLFAVERSETQTFETKRNFKGSICTSLAAVLLGAVSFALYSSQIRNLSNESQHLAEQADTIKAQTDQKVAARHKAAEQYKAISREGIPVTSILDAIAGSIQTGTGLAAVSVTPNLAVTIDGEASDETSMIRTMKTLEQCPLLNEVKIIGFRQLPDEKGVGISFQIGGKTFSADEIQVQKGVAK